MWKVVSAQSAGGVRNPIVAQIIADRRVYSLNKDIVKSAFVVDLCSFTLLNNQAGSKLLDSRVISMHVADYRSVVNCNYQIRSKFFKK